MVNKSAKALVFFTIALIAFLCSAAFATATYNMLAADAMEEAYSNSDNITVEDAQDTNNAENSNNHYYPNNVLSSDNNDTSNNESQGHNLFNINILNIFNATNENGEMDLHTLFDKMQNKISRIFSGDS